MASQAELKEEKRKLQEEREKLEAERRAWEEEKEKVRQTKVFDKVVTLDVPPSPSTVTPCWGQCSVEDTTFHSRRTGPTASTEMERCSSTS